jgi:hypothetical protein
MEMKSWIDPISVSQIMHKLLKWEWPDGSGFVHVKELSDTHDIVSKNNILIIYSSDPTELPEEYSNNLIVYISKNECQRAKKNSLYFSYLIVRETFKNFLKWVFK